MRSGNEDIWIKPVAGGEALQVTTDPASDIYAVWSPDGTQLAFASDRGGATNVAISRRLADPLAAANRARRHLHRRCDRPAKLSRCLAAQPEIPTPERTASPCPI